jgi:hypothetical protein
MHRLNRSQSCHDITLLRGCLIAGLPLILTERAEHYYKSMGWSPFHKITIINSINLPSCSCALPVNLDKSYIPFHDGGIHNNANKHPRYMMQHKALCFADHSTAREILLTSCPENAKPSAKQPPASQPKYRTSRSSLSSLKGHIISSCIVSRQTGRS